MLDLIAAGRSNADVAAALVLSPKTARNHVSNIFAKLHVADRSAAIVKAREPGSDSPEVRMNPPAPPTRLDRWSGACWIAAGLLLLLGTLHPDIFETTLAHVAAGALWVPIHVAALVAVVLTLFGLTGLYVARAERLGRLAAVGFVLAVVGLVMTACVAYAEAFLLPVIARGHPDVFDWDGPVTTSWAVRVTTGMALLWLVGLVLLGLELRRSGVVPAGAARTLVGGAVAFAVFGGLLIPVIAPLSTLVLAVGYAWIGVALWTGTTGRTPTTRARRPRLAAGVRDG